MASKRRQRRQREKGQHYLGKIAGDDHTPESLEAHRELELLRASARTKGPGRGEHIAQRHRLLAEAREQRKRAAS